MDTPDPMIQFDENGECNYCRGYDERAERELHYNEAGRQWINQLLDEIKEHGKDKEYDCLIGLSGGVDSSIVAYKLVKDFGLRPFAIHVDNGWNDDIGEINVEKIVKELGIELHSY